MADITVCPGTDCPVKEQCYRFTAPRSEVWQSYFMEINVILPNITLICIIFHHFIT